MTATVDRVLGAVGAAGGNPRRSGDGWSARCPAHDDSSPSLAISEHDGKVLVHCHAGCDLDAILAALGLQSSDLFDADKPAKSVLVSTYDYRTASADLAYQVVRMSPKTFRQRRPDGAGGWIWSLNGVERLPYRLPELIEGVAADRHVFVVEGERDVETLRSQGLVATCNPGGAGKWRSEFGAYFAGAKVTVVPDNDAVGLQHAQRVAASLTTAATVQILDLPDLPPHGDVTDWLNGHTVDDLKSLVAAAVSASGPRIKPIDWSSFWAKESPAEEWLAEPILPVGRQVGLYSTAKTGKSLLALDICAAGATGRPMLGQAAAEPFTTIYITSR